MTTGVIYFASGARFIEEASRSVSSLKRFHPDWSVTLFTDGPLESSLFDNIVQLDPTLHPLINRLVSLQQSPYDRTFALDTDTFVCAPLGDLFQILDRFELAGTLLVRQIRNTNFDSMTVQEPELFEGMRQISPGALLYQNNETVRAFLQEWERLYKLDKRHSAVVSGHSQMVNRAPGDLQAMRLAFSKHPLRWMPLTNEYNCVYTMPGTLFETVRILHGRHPNPQAVVDCLNSIQGERVHVINGYTLTVIGATGETRRVSTLSTAAVLNEYRKDLQDVVKRRGVRKSLPYVAFRFGRWKDRFSGQLKSVIGKRD